jgi:hypothetical protein
MADCDWMILCDYAFRDEGRKSCLIGTFDRIFARSVPVTHSRMALAFKLVGDADEPVKFRVQIARPSGAELGQMGGETKLSEVGTTEINLNVINLQLPDFGVYAFNLYVNDQLAKAASFSVLQPPQQK